MGEKSKSVKKNKDGTTTRKTVYGDGSGHSKTTKGGVLFDKFVSGKSWGAKK